MAPFSGRALLVGFAPHVEEAGSLVDDLALKRLRISYRICIHNRKFNGLIEEDSGGSGAINGMDDRMTTASSHHSILARAYN